MSVGEAIISKIWRLALVALVLLSCVGCDRATKFIAREALASTDPISLLNGSIRFEYVENPGALLSLGADLPDNIRFLLLVIFVGFVLALTLAFTIKARTISLLQLLGLSLIIGGGIGNLIDRIFNEGAVVDFVSLGIGSLRTGVFNMADVAIISGIIIFLLFST